MPADGPNAHDAATAAHVVANNLRVDHTTSVVLRALDDEGVPAILLKGPSTVRWLHAERPRTYHDCDLLVSPAAGEAAERVLRALGFAPTLEQEKMPAWWRQHSVEWLHAELALVDLHRTLKGVGVDDARLWEVLSAETETMVVGGHPSTVLSIPARALQIALNRAGDGFDNGDLARAVESVGDGTWDRAADLADRVDATEAFTSGLRLVAQGQALADRMGLPTPTSVDAALRTGRLRRQALTVDRLARASGTRERMSIVGRKMLPPPTFMRHWSPRARRGRAGLLLSYAQRVVWVTRSVPSAVRAWRRARRTAQADPPHEV